MPVANNNGFVTCVPFGESRPIVTGLDARLVATMACGPKYIYEPGIYGLVTARIVSDDSSRRAWVAGLEGARGARERHGLR